jgi:DNA polymerase III epsilon subunit-like protein
MLTLQNFLVVDTEGKDQLKEIAVLDSQGRLVYEAFSTEHNRDISNQQNVKPLREILTDFSNLSQSQLLIFHYANHDLEVLKNSYQAVNLNPPLFTSLCTLQLAQRYVNNFESYSLEYLSKKLNLQINNIYS